MKLGTSATLACSGLSLSLGLFNLAAPGLGIYGYQNEAHQASVKCGIAGYALQEKSQFESKYIFDGQIYLKESEFRLFIAIWLESQKGNLITLSNSRQTVVETLPRTRAIASGSESTPTDDYTEYFAQWSVLIVLSENWFDVAGGNSTGPIFRASFMAYELEKVT